ncbi:hypothetical protein CHUAL_009252 [Chamberlinius hualienensis]
MHHSAMNSIALIGLLALICSCFSAPQSALVPNDVYNLQQHNGQALNINIRKRRQDPCCNQYPYRFYPAPPNPCCTTPRCCVIVRNDCCVPPRIDCCFRK